MDELFETRFPLAMAGAAHKKWTESVPGQAWTKLLWADPETGVWASLYRWKKGYVAPPHVHSADAHMLVLSGKLKVRDGVYGPGDYAYEPKDAVHGATTTLEDAVYFFVCNGPIRMDGDESAGRPPYEVTCENVIATDARG
jgi:quercetin dioxygenase-like cupin family protein